MVVYIYTLCPFKMQQQSKMQQQLEASPFLRVMNEKISVWYVNASGTVLSSNRTSGLFNEPVRHVAVPGLGTIDKDEDTCVIIQLKSGRFDIVSTSWGALPVTDADHTLVFIIANGVGSLFQKCVTTMIQEINKLVDDSGALIDILEDIGEAVLQRLVRVQELHSRVNDETTAARMAELEDDVMDYLWFYTEKPGSLYDVYKNEMKPAMWHACAYGLPTQVFIDASKEYSGDINEILIKIRN